MCHICLDLFDSRARMNVHKKETHWVYDCENKRKLKNGKKKIKMNGENDGNGERKMEKLKRDERQSKTSKEKNFVCSKCRKPFARKYTLVQHLLTHLPREDRLLWRCTKCPHGVSFTRKQHLETHYKSFHNS